MVALVVTLFTSSAWTPIARAASAAEKSAAIRKGLAYLHASQQPNGSWATSGSESAATAAVAFAFLSQRDEWDYNADRYQASVDKAISYLLQTAALMDMSRSG